MFFLQGALHCECRSGVCKHVHRHRRQLVEDGKLIQYFRSGIRIWGGGVVIVLGSISLWRVVVTPPSK